MSPKLATVEVAVGQDSDESTGVEPSGDFGAGQSGELTTRHRSDNVGCELPPGQAIVAAVSDRGRARRAAWARGSAVEPAAGGAPSSGRGADSSEVQRAGDRAVRPDAGRRTLSQRRRAVRPSGDAAPLDARRGAVESGATAGPPIGRDARGKRTPANWSSSTAVFMRGSKTGRLPSRV
jgi:hypothetical protein